MEVRFSDRPNPDVIEKGTSALTGTMVSTLGREMFWKKSEESSRSGNDELLVYEVFVVPFPDK